MYELQWHCIPGNISHYLVIQDFCQTEKTRYIHFQSFEPFIIDWYLHFDQTTEELFYDL